MVEFHFIAKKLELLPPKPKFTFRHLKKGIQKFHRRFVLAPADKAANNVVAVWKRYYINTLSKNFAMQKHMSITGLGEDLVPVKCI